MGFPMHHLSIPFILPSPVPHSPLPSHSLLWDGDEVPQRCATLLAPCGVPAGCSPPTEAAGEAGAGGGKTEPQGSPSTSPAKPRLPGTQGDGGWRGELSGWKGDMYWAGARGPARFCGASRDGLRLSKTWLCPAMPGASLISPRRGEPPCQPAEQPKRPHSSPNPDPRPDHGLTARVPAASPSPWGQMPPSHLWELGRAWEWCWGLRFLTQGCD